MKVELNWNPPARTLRQFGWLCLLMLPLLAWLFSHRPGLSSPWTERSTTVLGGFAIAGALLAAAGTVRPGLLRPLFVGACLVTMPIGILVGELLLLFTYFGIFMPIALFFRAIGRDELQRRLDRSATSYWQVKSQPADVGRYFRQF